jgi:hypothetical protein
MQARMLSEFLTYNYLKKIVWAEFVIVLHFVFKNFNRLFIQNFHKGQYFCLNSELHGYVL